MTGLLAGFPFVNEVSRAVALSGLITPVVRGAMTVAPLFAIRASTPGTGKSYLVDLAAAISTGRPCPVSSAGQSEEELEKRLTGMLLGGSPIICIDNANGELGGALLCQATERPLVSLRKLGGSDNFEVPAQATLYCTGNNLRVSGDMTRRTLICDLDADMERPELRVFPVKPVDLVVANRGLYVSASLIIARAYVLAGRPGLLPQVGSYEGWSDTVRSALVWLGCADPADSMNAAREDDPELADHREVLAAWEGCHGFNSGLTVKELIDPAAMSNADPDTSAAATALRDCFQRIAGRGSDISAQRLGIWLAAKKGRIVGGRRIVRSSGETGGAARWQLQATGAGA